jgi:branched-chain amino acid transport system ATP-binding protein
MLELRSVARRFGGMKAVDGVSLTVQRGEIAGLIGPNGAGKTTLFNLAAGSLAPSGGAILLDGQPIESEPAHRRLARGLGRTFQIPRPFPEMSVLENLLVAARQQAGERIWPNFLAPRRIAAEEKRNIEKARELLAFVTLDRLADQPARILSGGQRKLLELARVMMAEPQIILLDEPAAGVNAQLLDTIVARIQDINRRGVTLLIIEHNMDVIIRLCARVFVMAEGRLLAEGAPRDIARDPRVIEAYLGRTAA